MTALFFCALVGVYQRASVYQSVPAYQYLHQIFTKRRRLVIVFVLKLRVRDRRSRHARNLYSQESLQQ